MKQEQRQRIDFHTALLLDAVEQMERDFALKTGGTLLPSACVPAVEAAKKLRAALTEGK